MTLISQADLLANINQIKADLEQAQKSIPMFKRRLRFFTSEYQSFYGELPNDGTTEQQSTINDLPNESTDNNAGALKAPNSAARWC